MIAEQARFELEIVVQRFSGCGIQIGQADDAAARIGLHADSVGAGAFSAADKCDGE
jgi:hypothetical protein